MERFPAALNHQIEPAPVLGRRFFRGEEGRHGYRRQTIAVRKLGRARKKSLRFVENFPEDPVANRQIFRYNRKIEKASISMIYIASRGINMVLREKVYQVLRERIVNGEYRPGEPLNEKQIIEELQVSRTPFREAVNALSQENLVQIFANRGIFVRDITAKDLADSFEIRYLLEPHVSQLACQHMPDEVIEALISRSEASRGSSYQEMLQADDAFHQSLLEHCDNRQMKDILLRLHDQNKIQISMHDRICAGMVSAERIQEVQTSLCEHIQILEAMKRRDAQAVTETTQMHLVNARKRASRLF